MVKITLFSAQLVGRLVNLRYDAANSGLVSHNTLFLCCCYGVQLVNTKTASLATSRDARKQHFSASEISVLNEKVEENLSVLQSKLKNCIRKIERNC